MLIIVILLLVLLLALIAAFLSIFEIAFIGIKISHLKELAAKGDKRAALIAELKAKPDKLFTTVRIARLLLVLTASVIGGIAAAVYIPPLLRNIGGAFFQNLILPVSAILAMIAIACLFLITSELLPKAVATRRDESIILKIGLPGWHVLRALLFFPAIIGAVVNFMLKLFRTSPAESGLERSMSEAESTILGDERFPDDDYAETEHKLIRSVFEFADTTVRRAMTPRTEIIAVEISDPPEKLLKIATEERFSRFPVYEENLDNIKGIIHSRDLLYVYTHKELFVLGDIIKPANFSPDSRKTYELLKDMQKYKYHMAIVLDEFGGTAGLITMEDVLEELVGDIQDEYDKESLKIEFLNKNKAVVKASMPVDEFADEFEVAIEDGDFETVAGMVVTKLGRIPSRNEITRFDGFSLKVKEKDGHRIISLLAEKTRLE